MKTTSAATIRFPLSDGSGEASRGFWKAVVVVVLAEVVAIAAFYGLEWAWLRNVHLKWLQFTLHALGSHVQTAGTLLTVDGRHFQIDADCTYVDLIICSSPLLWRPHRRLRWNLSVLAGFAIAVVAVNLGRVLYGVYATVHGVNLFWAHDFVDYVLWYPTIGIVALLWMRSLKTLWRDTPTDSGKSRSDETPSQNHQSLVTSAVTNKNRQEAAA